MELISLSNLRMYILLFLQIYLQIQHQKEQKQQSSDSQDWMMASPREDILRGIYDDYIEKQVNKNKK